MKPAQLPKVLSASLVCVLFIVFLPISPNTNKFNPQQTAPLTGGQAALSGLAVSEPAPKIVKTFVATADLVKGKYRDVNTPVTSQPVVKAISPAFRRFVRKVADGQAGVIRGVYVDETLALRVLQQPEDNAAFVSNESGTATQFRSAANYGITGLLAHNYLSGRLFYNLVPGQEIRVVFGDASFQRFKIESFHRFQKLTPSSLQSDFIDLSTGEKMTTGQVFNQFYKGDGHLTLQTCLAAKGISNWGLTFIIATPVEP